MKGNPSISQQKAISHTFGPAMILAGPGSGKTFTIIQRIMYLIEKHKISPESILTVTFTKAAALQMQQRFRKEAGEQETVFGTFHSICYSILRESGAFQGYSLINESTKRKIAEILLLKQKSETEVDYDSISSVLDAISRRKNMVKEENLFLLSTEEFERYFTDYQDMLKEQKLLDFDDMIGLCYKLLTENEMLCRKWQKRFTYLLVDEFQDINEMQYRVIKLLACPENHLFVVGDDDQSIYGFRGAAPGIMKQFTEDFPEAEIIYLQENFRSGDQIVELAGKVIARNTNRFAKTPMAVRKGGKCVTEFCETRKQEEEKLICNLKKEGENKWQECAVILRTNSEVFQYISLLKKAGIPVRERLQDHANIFQGFIRQDLEAFLRFCREGRGRKDFLKIMNKPNLYLTRQALTEEIVTEQGMSLYYSNHPQMRKELHRLFQDFDRASAMSPSLAIRYFRFVMGYENYLRNIAKNGEMFQKWTEQLTFFQNLFREMKPDEKTEEFLKQKEREQGKRQEMKITEGVSVITMHMAKGLEYDHVFLPDLNEGVIPGRNSSTPESLEEERRLLYVAITRAREHLYLYYTGERNRRLSRFLTGIIDPPP